MKIKSVVDENVTNEMLALREKNWRKELPSTFKTFIRSCNGGIPETKITIGEKWYIERFLCIVPDLSESPNGEYDIDAVITKYDEFMVFDEDTLGYDLIPFAQLNHDSLLCLCYDTLTPSVVVWQLEGSEEFKPKYSKCFDTFEQFMDVL
jgi:hypothetical protein